MYWKFITVETIQICILYTHTHSLNNVAHTVSPSQTFIHDFIFFSILFKLFPFESHAPIAQTFEIHNKKMKMCKCTNIYTHYTHTRTYPRQDYCRPSLRIHFLHCFSPSEYMWRIAFGFILFFLPFTFNQTSEM